MKTLTELRLWNLAHARAGAIKYGQSLLDISDEMDVVADKARYEADRAKDLALGGDQRHRCGDAGARSSTRCSSPAAAARRIAAKAGLSDGHRAVRHRAERAAAPPFPAGFDAKPAPFGVSFTGWRCSEPRLIELAYAFEQATKRRVPPQLGR